MQKHRRRHHALLTSDCGHIRLGQLPVNKTIRRNVAVMLIF